MEFVKKAVATTTDTKKFKILSILTCLRFFKDRNIQGDDLHILAQGLTIESMDAGDIVFKAGTLGEKFYIILKGSVKILIPIKDKTTNDKRKSLFDQTEVNTKPNKIDQKQMEDTSGKKSLLFSLG